MNKQNSLLQKLLSCIRERRLPWRISHQLYLFKKRFGFIRYESVVVETSSLCNISCIWCWMYFSKKKDMGLMNFQNFKKFIDLNASYLKKKKIVITPYHRGEALIHPEFFKMLDYANKKGVTIDGIHTNLSLKLDINRLMESPLPFIVVNIGGLTQEIHQKVMRGSDFGLVINNLKEIFSMNKLNKPIYIKMNPAKDNVHQIKELPAFFQKLGGDPKNAIIGTTGFSLPAEASKEEVNEFFLNVVSKEVEPYLRFTYDSDKNIFAKEKKCPFMVPTIKWDGKVTICCHDLLSRLNLGNAFETSLKDILESKEYRIAEKKGKKREFFFCKNCN